MKQKPSTIHFTSVEDVMRLALETGIEECIAEIADYIEEDFRRWPLFDKTPCVTSHPPPGQIILG